MQQSMTWTSWTTAGASGDGVAYWSDVVMRGVIDADMEPVGRENFAGQLTSRTVGEARFVNFRTHSHRISRTARQARRGHGLIMVGLQCEGLSLVEQGDARIQLTPGQIALVDSSAPFNLLFPQTVERRLVLLPSWLFSNPADAKRLRASPRLITSNSGAAQLAREAILRLTDTEHDWNERDCAAMLRALVPLLETCLQDEPDQWPTARFARIKAQMQAHLPDRTLDPTRLADLVGLSTRSLYREFARQGYTFSRLLLELRLQKARALIESNPEMTLAAIAQASGFSDSAHFSRSFRAAYGETPRDARARLR